MKSIPAGFVNSPFWPRCQGHSGKSPSLLASFFP
jgi:hypothetical protein